MKTDWLLVLMFLITSITFKLEGQFPNYSESCRQPTSVFDTPADFTGWMGEVLSPQRLSEIGIGLFMPYDSIESIALPTLWGAELAVSECNLAGGFHGIPFRLKTRWSYDPWGAGSKEMIKLVYQDSVWAVIGSLDGTATHVAQQIATKARIALLSPVSADPTLTYIRIPWIFRLPPDFEKQATVITRKGIIPNSLKKVGILTSTDHDGRTFASEMIVQLNAVRVNPLFHFEVNHTNFNLNQLVQILSSYEMEGIILYLPPMMINSLLSKFSGKFKKATVILPWIPALDSDNLTGLYDGNIYYIQPFSTDTSPAYTAFFHHYLSRYQIKPTAEAAYMYDAVRLLISSLFKSGLSRSRLRDEIANLGNFQGVTGLISWDNGGGNKSEPILKILQEN